MNNKCQCRNSVAHSQLARTDLVTSRCHPHGINEKPLKHTCLTCGDSRVSQWVKTEDQEKLTSKLIYGMNGKKGG